jgi:MYXO-CTERM domain-containing protein
LPLLSLLLCLPALGQTRIFEELEMPDGATLATDIWVADGEEELPHPVILRRTPYGRYVDPQILSYITNAGFALVSQDVRGRGGSTGQFIPYADDAKDGAATIDWIANQAFSDGQVGTFGLSAEGIVQFLAMGEGPSALKCAHVGVAVDDVYAAAWAGGAPRKELTEEWLELLGAEDQLDDVYAGEVLSELWEPARLDDEERAASPIPLFLYGGYFDIWPAEFTKTHRAFQAVAESQGRDDVFMVLGPWTHTGFWDAGQGDLTFPASASYDRYWLELFAYFQWCLGGGNRPNFPPVKYWVTALDGEGENVSGFWSTSSHWPPPESVPTDFHLHHDGLLRKATQNVTGKSRAVAVDPENAVPALGGGFLLRQAGPVNQAEVELRDDVIIWDTPPAEDDVEVVGEVNARIWASSATTDVDVVVQISQLTPDGRSLLMAHGVRRGRFIQGPQAIVPLKPDEPALFEVDLGPIGLRLAEGHALRVVISGTSDPRYMPNPNVAEPLVNHPTPTKTTLTVYGDADHPSVIQLPLLDGTFPEVDPPEEELPEETGCDCHTAGSAGMSNALFALAFFVLVGRLRRRQRL